ncbi:MAG TPA: hypothetical protein VHF26_05635 [Trebonia sp.]|nr:hypothetical protein [Trebonia sp.]
MNWLHDSEIAAARAEHEAGDILDSEGRAWQQRLEARLEADPEFAAWADRKYLERWGVPRPGAQSEAEAEP